MSTVYSKQLLAALGASGTTVAGPVPSGTVWVLRDLDAYWGGGLSPAEIWLRGSLGQTIFHWGRSSPDSASVSWRGRQVLGAGETFSVVTLDAMDVTVSGYELWSS